jgi:hypothetical protein
MYFELDMQCDEAACARLQGCSARDFCQEAAVCFRGRWARGGWLFAACSAHGEELTGLFRGVGFTVAALLEAEFEVLVDDFAVLL